MNNENLGTTYVRYEIYNPYTLEVLDLSCCKESDIIMNIPVKLDPETAFLFDSLSKYNYNLFDPNDSFYNDICAVYKTENGTDIILEDRKNDFYKNNGNKTLCQNECSLKKYNSANKKAECECSIQKEINDLDLNEVKNSFNQTNIINNFYGILKNSNYLVLKCYKLVFNLKNIFKNIGMIIMTIILIISIILIIIHYKKEQKKIFYYIQSILKLKFFLYLANNDSIQKLLTFNPNKLKPICKINKSSIIFNINKKKIKRKKLAKNLNDISEKSKNNLYSKSNRFGDSKVMQDLSSMIIRKEMNDEISEKKVINCFNSMNKHVKKEWIEEFKSIHDFNMNNKKINKLTEKELNTLNYKNAIKKDKRTYLQYYWSLLKQKHLIIFTFVPMEDYNLYCIKISLFLVTFSLSLTINAFFFDDETMHKIYKNYGNFNFLYQIGQILYSTVICAVINGILKFLSLSQQQILDIKQQKDFISAFKKSESIKKCIKIKYVIFYFFMFIFLLFFWYFISCFCIVYNNTQILLFKDTLMSFGLSLVYPFGLNLLPGLLRIPALRAEKRNMKCLYKISLLVALI